MEIALRKYQCLELQLLVPEKTEEKEVKSVVVKQKQAAKPALNTSVNLASRYNESSDSDDNTVTTSKKKKRSKSKKRDRSKSTQGRSLSTNTVSGMSSAPTGSSNQSQGILKPDRWECPLEGHEDHNIQECDEFFGLSPNERRDRMRFTGCYVCLGRGGGCRNGICKRLGDIPTGLICRRCAEAGKLKGRSGCNVACCQRHVNEHPAQAALVKDFEAWIPKLSMAMVGGSVKVNLVSLYRQPPQPEEESCLRATVISFAPPKTAFDTQSGECMKVGPSSPNVIVRQSKEHPSYVMQTVLLGGREVTIFYDSGSTTNLVEGDFAESAGFVLLDNRSVRVSVMGGGYVETSFGRYSCLLGPDSEGQYHELEMQGLDRITTDYPEIDLTPLWKEGDEAMGVSQRWPRKLGCGRVTMLIGINSSHLTPRISPLA
jgi:hypothetical protein